MPLPARTTTAWVHFPGIDAAIAPVRDLVSSGATAVELMVAPALIVAAYNMVGAPEEWKELPPESAVLLVEFGAESDAELDSYVAKAGEIFAAHETIRPIEFSRDAEEIELAWRVREGLHGLVGRVRPAGTALIVEDVCVPPERIAEGARDLQALLGEHGFLPGVAGHASAGNLHFMLTPDFAKREDLERYESFMAKLVELIVGKYDGSLKAEHGTGINMAPYVEREWGEKATELMWRVKALADPDGVLAPGVVLNRDPGVHLRNLKTTPEIEQSVDHLRRVRLLRAGLPQPQPDHDAAAADRPAAGDRPPAGGLAAAAGAGGGVLLRRPRHLRRRRLLPPRLPARDRHRRPGQGAARRAAHAARRSLGAARGEALGGGGEGVAGGAADRRPAGAADQARRRPAAGGPVRLPETEREGAAAVYVPSCTNRIFGRNLSMGLKREAWPVFSPSQALAGALAEVSREPGCRSGSRPMSPAAAAACRGALKASATRTGTRRTRWSSASGRWSGEGGLPVVIDAASCTGAVAEPGEGVLGEENAERLAAMTILDSVAWAHDRLLPQLEIARQVGSATVHPTCATRQLGLAPRLRAARQRPRRGGLRRPLGDLLRLRRRPRLLPPRADRGGDGGPGGRAGRARFRRPPEQQPHLRDRPQPRHRRAL